MRRPRRMQKLAEQFRSKIADENIVITAVEWIESGERYRLTWEITQKRHISRMRGRVGKGKQKEESE